MDGWNYGCMDRCSLGERKRRMRWLPWLSHNRILSHAPKKTVNRGLKLGIEVQVILLQQPNENTLSLYRIGVCEPSRPYRQGTCTVNAVWLLYNEFSRRGRGDSHTVSRLRTTLVRATNLSDIFFKRVCEETANPFFLRLCGNLAGTPM